MKCMHCALILAMLDGGQCAYCSESSVGLKVFTNQYLSSAEDSEERESADEDGEGDCNNIKPQQVKKRSVAGSQQIMR